MWSYVRTKLNLWLTLLKLMKLNKSHSFSLCISLWAFCAFSFLNMWTVSLHCANVYAHMHALVGTTFYRLTLNPFSLLPLLRLPVKELTSSDGKSIANSLTPTAKAVVTHGKLFLQAVHCRFCFLRCKQVPVITWHLALVRAPQSLDLRSMCLRSKSPQFVVSLSLFSQLYSFECNLVWINLIKFYFLIIYFYTVRMI